MSAAPKPAPTPVAHDEPTGLGWALWPALAALPWLLPTHSNPWTTFYSEALMAAALVPLAAWALWRNAARWRIDALAAGLALVALVPAAQAAAGLFAVPGEALWIGLYLSGMALAVALAQRAHALSGLQLADALQASLLLAALASTGLALAQWAGLEDPNSLMALPVAGGRPAANLGQPNNLSTLLVWGLIAVWWAHWRGRIGGAVAVLGAAFLLMGIALTQSRTGLLAVGLLAAAAVFWRRPLGTARQAPALIALALWFVAVVVLLEPASHALLRSAPLTLAQQTQAGKRPMIWALALEAIGRQPWFGYGWNQTVTAHVALAQKYPDMHVAVAHAHNVVLDLMLWNGVPLALVMVGGLLWLAWYQLRAPLAPPQILLLLALGAFGLHAMLELPHVYAFFLLPAALMAGTLGALRPLGAAGSAPRAAVAVVVAVHAALLAGMFVDYPRIEADATTFRLRQAHIGVRHPAPPPNILVLWPLQSAMQTFRSEPQHGMDAPTLAQWRRIAERYPTPFGLLRYAHAAALNGQPDEARRALVLLCTLYSEYFCNQASTDWAALAELPGNAELQALPPPWK